MGYAVVLRLKLVFVMVNEETGFVNNCSRAAAHPARVKLLGARGVRESRAHAKCFTHFLGDGQVSLSAASNSAVGKLGLGTSFTGFSNPVWIKHCRVKYRVGYF
jgi:hypothetical protein